MGKKIGEIKHLQCANKRKKKGATRRRILHSFWGLVVGGVLGLEGVGWCLNVMAKLYRVLYKAWRRGDTGGVGVVGGSVYR